MSYLKLVDLIETTMELGSPRRRKQELFGNRNCETNKIILSVIITLSSVKSYLF